MSISGSYSTSKDTSKMTLNGQNLPGSTPARPSRVDLQLQTDDTGYSTVLSMKAKLLGQSVRQ
jgi:hypothetical protein